MAASDRDGTEKTIREYISTEIVTDASLPPLKNDTGLFAAQILDSLSLLKLVLFLEQKFGVTVTADELVPENFSTIDKICDYLRAKSSR